MKLRVRFSKFGPIKFIGHLDTMRFVQKAIKAAGIPVKYTEGFSPHQVQSYFHIIHIHLYTTEQIIFLLSCAHNFLFFDGTILKQSEQIIVWIQNTLYTRG